MIIAELLADLLWQIMLLPFYIFKLVLSIVWECTSAMYMAYFKATGSTEKHLSDLGVFFKKEKEPMMQFVSGFKYIFSFISWVISGILVILYINIHH